MPHLPREPLCLLLMASIALVVSGVTALRGALAAQLSPGRSHDRQLGRPAGRGGTA